MSCSELLYRHVVANALTAYYGFFAFILIVLDSLKGLFVSTAPKRKLEPPTSLSDPKYGVHKYTKANNIKLHYVESGDPSKPLMLFLHGFPEFWYSWRHQIVDFQKDYWCVAMDMRGYGDSERPEGLEPYKLDELIADVRELIKQLGREKCILVSHDWGGLVASKFRDEHPEMLLACILLASMSQHAWVKTTWSNPKQRRKSWYVFMYRIPGLAEQVLQLNNLALFDKVMLVPGKDTITAEDIECYKYWFGKTLAFTPPINYYRANFKVFVPEKQTKGKVPMLVAHASNDPYIELSVLDLMKEEYDAETAVVENTGHFLQQEEPAKVNNVIRQFLTKHNI
uniref:Soluble spoxide hydrolase n=1 Tax=Maruca vitrata TaxID=497515 RepID=A0AAU7BB66_MARVT